MFSHLQLVKFVPVHRNHVKPPLPGYLVEHGPDQVYSQTVMSSSFIPFQVE